jgi:peptidoglycan/xylan/chitin deacetylase (PgdA/CDA1 family)
VTLFGPTLWHGPRSRPVVALTFDDGPHAEFTPRIARVLKAHRTRATFFCVGSQVNRNIDLVRALVDAGHELGNHSYTHNTFGDLFSMPRLAADLERNQALLSTYGTTPRFYRPAVGVRNPAVHAAARRVGLSIVTWSASARDGSWPLTEARALRMAARARPGDIITLHEGMLSPNQTALREATVRALPALLSELEARGLSCVTLSELVDGEGAADVASPSDVASASDEAGAIDAASARVSAG